MPSAYTRALKLPLRTSLGEAFYSDIMDLAMSYNLNYELLFPPVENTLVTIQTAKMMILPLDSIMIARMIFALLSCVAVFPVNKNRIFPTDHPEILLMALLVVATKMAFPFKKNTLCFEPRVTPRLDWSKWTKAVGELVKRSPPETKKYDKVTAEEISAMSDKELSAYFTYLSSFIDKKGK
jgi:RNA polymerase I-specific transcription initiation factor RRN7